MAGCPYHTRMGEMTSQLERLVHSPAGAALVVVSVALTLLAMVASSLRTLGGLYRHFIRGGRNLRQYGEWAVVTGATDGIGKAYAEALAKQRLRLVLISRTASRLEEEAKAITDKFGVEVRVVAADLTSTDPAVFSRIQEALKPLDVGILVNNAGMSYPHPEYMHVVGDEDIKNIVNLNVLSLSKLCRIVLGGMKERGRGLIVNVGSGAATAIPSGPLLAVYTASKAYVDALSRSLDHEYREFGVRVQNQAPLFVATKMSKIRRARIDAPTPEVWAAAAVRAMGYETVFFPYWFHALQAAAVKLLPASLVQYQVMQIHRSLRRAAYRKKSKAAAELLRARSGNEAGEAPAPTANGVKKDD
ncbi:hypothetical protein ACKKBF_B10185 [Auxenochlorella protothecoides x Auxenochlorella symbiontica]